MLNFNAYIPAHTDFAVVHLRTSVIEGDTAILEYFAAGWQPGAATPTEWCKLERPFLDATTGISLRSSKAASGKLADSLWKFLQEKADKGGFLSLPLIVSADAAVDLDAWTDFVQTALPVMPLGQRAVEVVCWRASTIKVPELPPPLTLPLRIACRPELCTSILESSWYFGDPDVRQHVISVEPWDGISSVDADVLVLSEASRGQGLQLPSAAILSKSVKTLRLAIILDPTPQTPFKIPATLLGNAAVAVVPLAHPAMAKDALRFLIEEIVHDVPLHEVMRLIRTRLGGSYSTPAPQERDWQSLTRLYADSVSNHAVRLLQLVPEVDDLIAAVLPATYATRFKDLAARLGTSLPEGTAQRLEAAFKTLNESAQPLQLALDKRVVFDKESNGLVPLAGIVGSASRLRQSLQLALPELQKITADERVMEALESHQARRLDARLFGRHPDATLWPIPPRVPLQSGQDLTLKVHIGQRSEASLLINEPPALDPLLPPLPGESLHEIVLTLFPKDFSLESPATQTVRLSRLGGTAAVEWNLKAPRVVAAPPEAQSPLDNSLGVGWITGSQASLRVNAYFRNQLLQSFKLTAVVGAAPAAVATGNPAVWMECDFSQTRRFGQLDKVSERSMSLALNEDRGSHELMLVKDGDSASVRWTEGQLARYTEEARNQLYQAMSINGASRFAFDPAELALQQESQTHFEPCVRALAKTGSDLYSKLFVQALSNPVLKQALTRIKAKEAQTIQISATAPDYAFPWTLLYDFEPPASVAPETQSVCRGLLTQGGPCNCEAGTTGLCLRGFWGLRLIIEQRAQGMESLVDAPGRISQVQTTPTVGLVTSVSDAFIDSWALSLQAKTNLSVQKFPDSKALLDTFRNGTSRPTVIVFAGHHRDTGNPGSPVHQLLSEQGQPILTLDDFRRSYATPWDAPRSLVFLLACASGAGRADTGPSLASALLAYGAAGVIATECTVYTPMVARVSRDILAALAASEGGQKMTMGRAVQQTLLRLAREGCPLGLAFTYYGIAEASLP